MDLDKNKWFQILKFFSVQNLKLKFEINSYFYENYKKKIKVSKYESECILFRIDVYFTEYFLAIEIDEQNHEGRELTFEEKRQEVLEKEPGCKFIRINTSNDTEHEVSKIQIFINEIKDNTIKEKGNKIKQLENKLKN